MISHGFLWRSPVLLNQSSRKGHQAVWPTNLALHDLKEASQASYETVSTGQPPKFFMSTRNIT